MMLFGAALIAGAVVLYVIYPIIAGKEAHMERLNDEPTEAEARKRVALLALRDVEYDHVTGKLDEEDYESLREELTAEALGAIEAAAVDSTGAGRPGSGGEIEVDPEDPLEREIAAFRAALGAGGGLPCPSCGEENSPLGRFCGHCGTPLASGLAAERPEE